MLDAVTSAVWLRLAARWREAERVPKLDKLRQPVWAVWGFQSRPIVWGKTGRSPKSQAGQKCPMPLLCSMPASLLMQSHVSASLCPSGWTDNRKTFGGPALQGPTHLPSKAQRRTLPPLTSSTEMLPSEARLTSRDGLRS